MLCVLGLGPVLFCWSRERLAKQREAPWDRGRGRLFSLELERDVAAVAASREDRRDAVEPVSDVVGGDIEVRVNGTVGYAAINSAINNLTDYNSALSATSGDTNYVDSLDTPAGPPVATLAGGSDASGGLDSAIVLEVAGADGADVLSFGAGTDITTIVNALNAVQDATGVVAADNGGILTLSSVKYGSDAFVSVTVSDGDSNGTFAGGLSAPARETRDIAVAA